MTISRRFLKDVILGWCVVCLASAWAAAPREVRKPNFVVIFIDDIVKDMDDQA